jgi:hypothetical protein
MNVVTPLHKALDLHRDQQSHGNRKQMQEKLSQAVELSVGQMNVEHERAILSRSLPSIPSSSIRNKADKHFLSRRTEIPEADRRG